MRNANEKSGASPIRRRRFLKLLTRTALWGSIGAVSCVAPAYSCVVTRREIRMSGLPPAFDGWRVALMSDFHHSPWIPKWRIRSAVALCNSLKPDLIALTGDFIDRGREWAPGCFEELAQLRGNVVGVLGNHDNNFGAGAFVRDAMRKAGIVELTNSGITLRHEGEDFHVGGVGDFWREKQNLRSALNGCRSRQSALLLSHNPDYVEEIRDARVGLVLSGHTHGGQVVIPFYGAPILPSGYGQKYAQGLCQGPFAQVFVTRGVGSSFPPVRFRCPAEIALLTLRRGKPS